MYILRYPIKWELYCSGFELGSYQCSFPGATNGQNWRSNSKRLRLTYFSISLIFPKFPSVVGFGNFGNSKKVLLLHFYHYSVEV